jgi:hypothetical protein
MPLPGQGIAEGPRLRGLDSFAAGLRPTYRVERRFLNRPLQSERPAFRLGPIWEQTHEAGKKQNFVLTFYSPFCRNPATVYAQMRGYESTGNDRPEASQLASGPRCSKMKIMTVALIRYDASGNPPTPSSQPCGDPCHLNLLLSGDFPCVLHFNLTFIQKLVQGLHFIGGCQPCGAV